MVMRILALLMAAGTATPFAQAAEMNPACLVPAPPATRHADLLEPYRALVDAYILCTDVELGSLAAAAGLGQGSARAEAERREALLAERRSVKQAASRYKRAVARAR
jgi:hypothetical protein